MSLSDHRVVATTTWSKYAQGQRTGVLRRGRALGGGAVSVGRHGSILGSVRTRAPIASAHRPGRPSSRGLSRTGAGAAARTLGPRRRTRPDDLQRAHRALTDLALEPAHDRGLQQLELGRPRGRVGPHRQHPELERHRDAVLGHLFPTICGQRPVADPTATSTFQPRSDSSRSIWSPSSSGSRPSRGALAGSPGRRRRIVSPGTKSLVPGGSPRSLQRCARRVLDRPGVLDRPDPLDQLLVQERAPAPHSRRLTSPRLTTYVRPANVLGTSASTAAVMSTCSQSTTIAARRSRRPESRLRRTPSRMRTRSSPRSWRRSWYAASFGPARRTSSRRGWRSPWPAAHPGTTRSSRCGPAATSALDLAVAQLVQGGEDLGAELVDLRHLTGGQGGQRQLRAASSCGRPGRRTGRR